ncbi:MAG: hypothetical protein J5X22_13010 [Candidatus Accumulibacter sp.]|uniref:hypothetical protein n=1 Tax=Accumulibacter sp. TaxID=2053492 RepID=UPI001B03884F|nr:hypothetical protein [Accumulibacter sp.]MBO3711393.1 hypothetical protein [Accumulibacter sp.]
MVVEDDRAVVDAQRRGRSLPGPRPAGKAMQGRQYGIQRTESLRLAAAQRGEAESAQFLLQRPQIDLPQGEIM